MICCYHTLRMLQSTRMVNEPSKINVLILRFILLTWEVRNILLKHGCNCLHRWWLCYIHCSESDKNSERHNKHPWGQTKWRCSHSAPLNTFNGRYMHRYIGLFESIDRSRLHVLLAKVAGFTECKVFKPITFEFIYS